MCPQIKFGKSCLGRFTGPPKAALFGLQFRGCHYSASALLSFRRGQNFALFRPLFIILLGRKFALFRTILLTTTHYSTTAVAATPPPTHHHHPPPQPRCYPKSPRLLSALRCPSCLTLTPSTSSACRMAFERFVPLRGRPAEWL